MPRNKPALRNRMGREKQRFCLVFELDCLRYFVRFFFCMFNYLFHLIVS
jgi:hypothetical protein